MCKKNLIKEGVCIKLKLTKINVLIEKNEGGNL